jgi:hypothetical protein
MKKILLMATVVSTTLLQAQKETFDIATFTRPKGWERLDTNGVTLLYQSKTANGLTSFCQIFLFPSHDANDDAAKNFQDEWANHIVKATGTTVTPQTQTDKTPDGWTAVSGRADVSQNGVNYTCMLTAVTGHGKEMSFVVNIAGQDYVDDVRVFFEGCDLRKPEILGQVWNGNDTPPEKGAITEGNYVYVVPAGWMPQKYPDGGVVITSPVYGTGEKCTISILPMRPLTSDLPTAANGIFSGLFSKNYSLVTTYTSPSMIRGISPQGWEYFILKQGLRPVAGNFSDVFAFVFVARLGNQVASIAGISKDPLVSNCFGLNLKDVWPKFFYSLQFKNWNSPGQENEIMKRMTGVWMAATATAGDRIVFAPNGRFAGASAAQRYYATSSNELLTVTDAYFGDGAYSIRGNQITLIHDNDKSKPEKAFMRLEQESQDGGRTWKDKLYLLRKSAVDGSEYELGYEKQNN